MLSTKGDGVVAQPGMPRRLRRQVGEFVGNHGVVHELDPPAGNEAAELLADAARDTDDAIGMPVEQGDEDAQRLVTPATIEADLEGRRRMLRDEGSSA